MASLRFILFFPLSIIFLSRFSTQISSTSPSPNTLLFPVAKDPATDQFTTVIHSPHLLQPIKLVVDLAGPSLWLDCGGLSAHRRNPLSRRSIQCSRANSVVSVSGGGHLPPTTTASSACILQTRNDVVGLRSPGQLAEGALAVRSTDGSTETVDQFLFSCGSTFLLNGLASGSLGMMGLGGRGQISPPAQFAAAFGFRSRRFAVCLPSNGDGVLAFGDSPIEPVFGTDVSRSMIYTPLVGEYLINLKSIRIDGERISAIKDAIGIGLAKLTTTVPYTLMETSLYKIFTDAYLKSAAAMGMRRVKPVSALSHCFARSAKQSAPAIDLALQSEMVRWRMDGMKSMAKDDGGGERGEVMCLGILDGGSEMEAAVVIGGAEMEDRVMEFDLDAGRLGFSSSLSAMEQRRTCSDFVSYSFPAAASS